MPKSRNSRLEEGREVQRPYQSFFRVQADGVGATTRVAFKVQKCKPSVGVGYQNLRLEELADYALSAMPQETPLWNKSYRHRMKVYSLEDDVSTNRKVIRVFFEDL